MTAEELQRDILTMIEHVRNDYIKTLVNEDVKNGVYNIFDQYLYGIRITGLIDNCEKLLKVYIKQLHQTQIYWDERFDNKKAKDEVWEIGDEVLNIVEANEHALLISCNKPPKEEEPKKYILTFYEDSIYPNKDIVAPGYHIEALDHSEGSGPFEIKEEALEFAKKHNLFLIVE